MSRKADMFKKIQYKSRIFFCFILLTLLLVGSLGVVNYLNSRRLMMDAAKLHTTDMLVQLKNTNDLLVQNMEQALRGSASYSDLELFAAQYPEMQGYDEKSAVFGRVADVLKLNTYFTACYVYYPQEKMVIDVNSRTPDFTPVNQSKEGNLVTAVYKAYQERKEDGRAFLCPIIRTGGETEWFMAVPVQYSSWVMEAPLLIVAIENSYFFQSLDTLAVPEDSQVFICTPQGEWLGGRRPEQELLEAFESRAGSSETGDFVYPAPEGKQLAVYTQSAQLGWQYLCATPLKTVYSQVRFLAYAGFFTAGLCAAAGVALARLLAGKLYLPIETLSGRLKGQEAQKPQKTDAFSSLYEGVDELLSQNAQMQRKLNEHEQIAKNAFLFKLLQGDIELYDSLYERFESYRIPFRENMRYLVALISLEQEESFRPSFEERQTQWTKVLQFDQALKDAFSTLSGFHLETVSLEEYTLAVIFGMENRGLGEREMAELLQVLQQDAQDRLGCPVTLGFSRLSGDIAKLPELGRQARAALEHQFFLGGSRAIGFGELPQEITAAYHYPWNTEKVILSHLRQGHLEQACQAIDEFEAYISSHIREAEQSRMAFLHLCTDMVQVGEELVPEQAQELTRDNIQQSLLACGCSADIVKRLKKYSAMLCGKIGQKRQDHTNDIARTALAFLEKNYNKPQMDLETLSQELGFSVSYISKMFKASTGVSIKEYITQKRIAAACELLLKTEKKVWEIGSAVGYDQQRSFLEIFKKYKGMTPSDYRRRSEGEV